MVAATGRLSFFGVGKLGREDGLSFADQAKQLGDRIDRLGLDPFCDDALPLAPAQPSKHAQPSIAGGNGGG